ncbi:hypothetical protein AciPR4_1409 [Terriglobus saanensis SP1PR4]|uniref:DUF3311 domain-containing protein n=2 Tax=Terriglobus saanensis TaxID=870903 RepID=E8V0U1_TERSS|nr:hypothetical protein AciPR4_1409 [Terriglobus saanensis SP1PR4]
MLQDMASKHESRWNPWLLLLVLPFVGLCFPQLYNRETPTLWGIPFFYAYQFVWVFLATLLLGIVYFKTKES